MSHIERQRRYRERQNEKLARAGQATDLIAERDRLIAEREQFITKRDQPTTLPPELIAERDRFVGVSILEVNIANDRRQQRTEWLGFTRAEWLEAGLTKGQDYPLFDNWSWGATDRAVPREFHAPDATLLALCGMTDAVERWRCEVLAVEHRYFAGDAGPPPAYWNMPDAVEQWEQANPDIVAQRKAEAEEQARHRAEAIEKDRLTAERRAKREANKEAKEAKAALATTTRHVTPQSAAHPVP
jgi:hypothetical protein